MLPFRMYLQDFPKYGVFYDRNAKEAIEMKRLLIMLVASLFLLVSCTDKKRDPQPERLPSAEKTIEESLNSLPDHPTEEDDILICSLDGMINMQLWDTFRSSVDRNEPAQIVIANYTVEGDIIYTLVSYDGRIFHAYVDNSRDRFGVPDFFSSDYARIYERTWTQKEDGRTYVYKRTFLTDSENGEDEESSDLFLWGTVSASE